MPPTSPLTISPLTPDQAHEYQSIRYETFEPTINKILYTRPPSQETLTKIIETTKHDISEKGYLYMACRDASTGEMIAGSRWRYVGPNDQKAKEKEQGIDPFNVPFTSEIPPHRSWHEVQAGLTPLEPYPESNPEHIRALGTLFNANKREILQTRPYYCLDTLVTHPSHHRRGAGGLLLQWGCGEADKRNVECYLEASLMGVPLYARYGFEKVRQVELDLADMGGEGRFQFVLMRRPARWEREGK